MGCKTSTQSIRSFKPWAPFAPRVLQLGWRSSWKIPSANSCQWPLSYVHSWSKRGSSLASWSILCTMSDVLVLRGREGREDSGCITMAIFDSNRTKHVPLEQVSVVSMSVPELSSWWIEKLRVRMFCGDPGVCFTNVHRIWDNHRK